MSLSPLAKKPGKPSRKSSVVPTPIIEKRAFVPDPPMLPSDTEEAELTGEESDDDETASLAPSGTTACENNEDEDEDEDEEEDEDYTEQDEDSDEWEPPSSKTPRNRKIASPDVSPSPVAKASKNRRVSKLARDLDEMHIAGQTSKVPNTNQNKKSDESEMLTKKDHAEDDDEEDELMLPAIPKKKKRYVFFSPVLLK